MATMEPSPENNTHAPLSESDIPDRMCTWCKVLMTKRIVGQGRFIHYTCPKCIFQHTAKRAVAPA
ncbi:MAG: hypothetical protein V3R11_01975 [Nitrospirales bacterium]